MVTGNRREGDGRSRDGGGENEASTRAALSLSTAQGHTGRLPPIIVNEASPNKIR